MSKNIALFMNPTMSQADTDAFESKITEKKLELRKKGVKNFGKNALVREMILKFNDEPDEVLEYLGII